jgi:sporulation integral membrane protein YlbJ
MRGKMLGAVLTGLVTLALAFSLVLYAEDGFHAAAEGLTIFLNVVFPSLLPFFVLSEIMLGMGIVHFMGVIFEPLMRPLFNVPGAGSFVLSMGLAAGYPMDAVITAKFRAAKMCTRIEAERLLAFTNTADPLFIFGAVAVGMFGMPRLGYTLAAAHYLAALCVGLCYRFYGSAAERRGIRVGSGEVVPQRDLNERGPILVVAAKALYRARREDGRSLGKMLGDSVNESVRTLLMVCGFIMLFSVLIKVLAAMGIVDAFGRMLQPVLNFLGISAELVTAMLSGAFEIDVGTAAASAAGAPFLQKAAVASAIIAWSGLSVHAQVKSVISGTDIRMGPYVFARFVHALFSTGFTLWLLGPAAPAIDFIARPAFGRIVLAPVFNLTGGFGSAFGLGMRLFLLSQVVMFSAGLVVVLARQWRRLRIWFIS